MCMVKGGKNESNTFGEGWGTFLPIPPPKMTDLRGIWGAAAGGDALGGPLVGWSERKKGRVGEKGLPWAHDIGFVAPALMARQYFRAIACGATGRATSSLTWHSAGSSRQRGHPVAPHALARQRLSVAPGQLARPNRLLFANKNHYGLNLKYY